MAQEPRKKAVAIRYDPQQDAAPRVVGKGQGAIAESILRIAQEHDIPVHEDADLVEVLAVLELGQLIPEQLYGALAEILAFLYRMNRKALPGAAA
jgi:flagellar biosynthesis protein